MAFSLNFILGFVGVAVFLSIALVIFGDVSDKFNNISVNEDVNCHVNYDHWSGCETQRTTFDGERGNDSSSFLVIGLIVLLIVPIIVVVRLL